MADKAISELVAAEQITATDMFVLEQNGTAKRLTGQVLLNWLTKAADGHGGIQSIEKLSTSGLADTYRITLADTTVFDFVVTNGRSVNSITKTSTSGLVDTYTISYNDGTTSTFTVTNGAKGDKGDNAYMWIKYASQEPTASSNSFGDVPDAWIGVYFGGLSSAPTDWQQYSWYQWKGEKGDTGAPATLVSAEVRYQVGDSGTIIPSSTWLESIPTVAQGKYLWTRIVQTFNSGDPVTAYTVSRMGIDGLGSVVSVAGISPDESGNVPLTAENVGALPIGGGTMEGAINMNGQKLSGLNEPTEATEAVPLGYLDGIVYTSEEDTEAAAVPIDADTLEGNDRQSIIDDAVEAGKPVLLWENASPTSEFAAQKITCQVEEYAGYEIGFKLYASDALNRVCNVRVFGKHGAYAPAMPFARPVKIGTRFITYSDDGLTFTDASLYTPGATDDAIIDNTGYIPIYIYGIA